jgi:phosphate transport system substrate-binding protein
MFRKRSFYTFIFAFICIIGITSCHSNKKQASTESFTSGDIKIAVDENFKPIIDEEIKVFEALNPEATITPIYCSEVDALNLLLKDSVRLAIVTRTLSQGELQNFKNKQYPVYQDKLATDGLGLIVNRSNKDTLITVDQVRDILTGKVTKWKQLAPSSGLGDIQVVFDNPNSSTVRYAIDSICNGKPFDKSRIFAQKTNLQVFNYVMHTKNAIGIIGVNWLDEENDTTNLSFKKGVNVMSVTTSNIATSESCLKPYQAYLALQTYPFTRSVYTICSDPRDQGLAHGFSNFLTTDKGQRIILKSALVPATQPVRLVQVKDSY